VSSNSVAGYRVREKLAFLPAQSDAVGRTSDIAGSLSAAPSGNGLSVTAATFKADVRTLKSDRSMRDERIHSFGLQSDQYPTAGFKLTQAIALPAGALHGQVVHVHATGLLTIHGTTRSVTIPITARLTGNQIETVGSITFPFTEFGMQAPSIGGFVSVENHATMEFDLRFQHGTSARNTATFRAIASAKPGSSTGSGLGPGGSGAPGPNNAALQAYAACMSKHGVAVPAGPPAGSPPTAGTNPNASSQNPKMAAALKACGSLQPNPGSGSPPSAGQVP
jgi:polyisoprenoid-binding protein YceI